MPWGKFEGKRMIDVPASYFFYLHTINKMDRQVQQYFEDNQQFLKEEAKKEKR